jgi:hypothetical protein
MRIPFSFSLQQRVVIHDSSRNGVVRSLCADDSGAKTARVEYVDERGRVVIEWFDEAALGPVGK